jgi:hypothetical protein
VKQEITNLLLKWQVLFPLLELVTWLLVGDWKKRDCKRLSIWNNKKTSWLWILQHIGNRVLIKKLHYPEKAGWKHYIYIWQLCNYDIEEPDLPKGTAGPGRPRMARLQLARRPSITGYGSMQAILADSGSLKVTCTRRTKRLKCIKTWEMECYPWLQTRKSKVFHYSHSSKFPNPDVEKRMLIGIAIWGHENIASS